jgi:outer membrane lipase/esterase
VKRFMMAAVSAAVLLSACGGGGNSGETKVKITSVKVVGASLADSGTFGYKFTVQPASSSTVYQVYPERIASTYGLSALCAAYSSSDGGVSYSSNSGCTNYAVAGAKVYNYYSDAYGEITSIPQSAVKQLQAVGAAGFSSSDLLIVGEAGANDAALLATAYLGQASGITFSALTTSVVGSTVYSTYSSAPATLGALYMQALADKLFDAVVTNALNNGAQRIVMLNTLDVTKTPKFQAVLTTLTSAYGSTYASSFQALVQAWIQAYNSRLATRVASYSSKVVLVDFYTSFNDEMTDPSQYGLTNTSATVCDQIVNAGGTLAPGVTSLSPDFTTSPATTTVKNACTDTAAEAITPTVGATGTTSWWKTYLFADNFHPTPYGHQLLAQLVAKRLTEAGWL